MNKSEHSKITLEQVEKLIHLLKSKKSDKTPVMYVGKGMLHELYHTLGWWGLQEEIQASHIILTGQEAADYYNELIEKHKDEPKILPVVSELKKKLKRGSNFTKKKKKRKK